eukprot:CAMPEP_0185013588 /NCGR_PEP_ID=MMETSP1098-20130426/98882_1 /TAXON_ID=89044 /ORGANISM="Spumella elongata, Strain CCAP 955/1" /LENGTH=395 /DNA_ID=CAMNT_0027542655 /DNA_START=18 /DNA_END=1206 /DNA_ORIENTATION=+
MSTTDQKLLQWGSTQGHILTGGGILEAQSIPGVHFQEEHLAHYWLKKRVTKQILRQWLDRNFRSMSIVGAWDRPLFSGGWVESTKHDTESFNLQTPSIFIDMRIPKLRPTAQIRTRENLASCSDDELRLLARQHCFSGYSFPEPDKSIEKSGALVFTRHHIIDWNYHPAFPRSRPNRWWVQTKDVENGKEGTDSFKEFSTVRDKFNNPVSAGHAGSPRLNSRASNKVRTCPAILRAQGLPWNGKEGTDSFKEFSTVRDKFNNPVYMERWERREPKAQQQGKYLALRKVRTCPAILRAQGLPPQKDSVLVMVGQHWLLAIDRDYSAVEEHAAQVERCKASLGSSFVAPKAQGGGPLFVDNLLSSEGSANASTGVEYALRRRAAEDYLSLEGSYSCA